MRSTADRFGQTSAAVRVMLVDDSLAFLGAARDYLRRAPGLVVVGAFNTAAEAIAHAAELRPEVILLDLIMPLISGMEAIPLLRVPLPDVAVVVLTMYDGEMYREVALEAGADEFVSKSEMVGEVLPAIQRALARRRRDAHLAMNVGVGSEPVEAVHR